MNKFLIGMLLALALTAFSMGGALASPAVPTRHDFAPHSSEWDAFYLDRYAETAPVTPGGSDTARDLLPGCHAKDSGEPATSTDL